MQRRAYESSRLTEGASALHSLCSTELPLTGLMDTCCQLAARYLTAEQHMPDAMVTQLNRASLLLLLPLLLLQLRKIALTGTIVSYHLTRL
jgi:hypothetical protein